MNFNGNTRQLARQLVDDMFYELHHTVSESQMDFTRVSQKEVVSLIDHIEILIRKSMGQLKGQTK